MLRKSVFLGFAYLIGPTTNSMIFNELFYPQLKKKLILNKNSCLTGTVLPAECVASNLLPY